jgi:hypothetical protein
MFGSISADLISAGLLEKDGQPHSVMRDIVLAAVEDEGLDMRLTSPVAEN